MKPTGKAGVKPPTSPRLGGVDELRVFMAHPKAWDDQLVDGTADLLLEYLHGAAVLRGAPDTVIRVAAGRDDFLFHMTPGAARDPDKVDRWCADVVRSYQSVVVPLDGKPEEEDSRRIGSWTARIVTLALASMMRPTKKQRMVVLAWWADVEKVEVIKGVLVENLEDSKNGHLLVTRKPDNPET